MSKRTEVSLTGTNNEMLEFYNNNGCVKFFDRDSKDSFRVGLNINEDVIKVPKTIKDYSKACEVYK